MNESTLLRAARCCGLGAAPLALAQEAIVQGELQDLGPPWSFITAISLGGMLIPIAIVAIINLSEFLQNRARLATIERIAAAGQTVPPALMLQGAPPLTLPEERRRDIRRGIMLLCWAAAVALVFYVDVRWATPGRRHGASCF